MRSEPAEAHPVLIVGGGFSGVMTAAHLAARDIPVVLVDGSGRLGRGVAYSTRDPVHLLNVTTSKMSAWPDQPNHFARWCGDEEGLDFAERRAFGRYLGEQLAAAPGVKAIDAMAVDARRQGEGWEVILSDGQIIAASALILAQGNQPPTPFPGSAGLPPELFVNNPWSETAHAGVERVAAEGSDVLILGTGLTMVDTVLSLVAAGHEGRITALSRRGLIPRGHVHPPSAPAPVALDEVPLGNLLSLWRWLRRRSATVGFRAAVDALRPHSHAIWQRLPEGEQRRFMRHARPWWDVHRHRIAPQVAEQLRALVAAGRLEIVAGRVGKMEADGGTLRVPIARRDGRDTVREVGVAFNCTGPLGDIRRTADPLLRSLLDQGAVRTDDFAMGLEVDDHSRAGEQLWALGPLTKGRYWEIVAVPDIRHQAEAVAADVQKELLIHV
ncbi:FAD/NAD(P)-binding protein [Sphingomonas glaciei]|uniref:FAD/NAD(P)-binding protein n=1 Tax=Sphingomonas glaciei TaxID=2938948 RepID=A0ABY5MWF6_9SPHN|nr:FAD/NAD(P)-binding protein [Sphingomonas glaciei]UUR08780.1 FAD/NAD(P)-binding protein [Sphingomonas glaciei]